MYEVFISFRGADIRHGFLSHLHTALREKKIDAFVDVNLDRGQEISPALLKTIEESYVSIVIFSENYAFSPWCLDELAKITECKKTMGQTVLPVFYRVDPTHVLELSGSFGDAIAEHRQEFKDNLFMVERWCQALKEVAGLPGCFSHGITPDSKLIEEIVAHVLEELKHMYPSNLDNEEFVGIDSPAQHVESLLCLESADVRIIGVWGIGGLGKTAIAREVFERICSQFTSQCFVENIREKLEKRTLESLQIEIFSKLLGTNSSIGNPIMSSSFNKRRLLRKKVLIFLDDVNDLEQTELLIGNLSDYGPGSRIILSSRDKQLLKNVGAEIYEVQKLNDSDALCLFCLHAFKQNVPLEGYMELSSRAIGYAQGIPQDLKVLGSNLYGKSVVEWEDELERLEGASDSD